MYLQIKKVGYLTIISSQARVGYEVVDSQLMSNVCSWYNCFIKSAPKLKNTKIKQQYTLISKVIFKTIYCKKRAKVNDVSTALRSFSS